MSIDVGVNLNLLVVLFLGVFLAHIILDSDFLVEWQRGKNARDAARAQNAGISMTCPCGRDCACFAPVTSSTIAATITQGTERQETKVKLA